MTDYGELVKALRCCDEYDLCNDCPIFETCDGDVDKAMAIAAAAIEALQAQLPKRGKWERELDVHDEPFYQCSVCGECFDSNRDSTHEVFKYCPDCGAKMEVQDGKRCD